MANLLIETLGLSKSYRMGAHDVAALAEVSIAIEPVSSSP